jgi:hypothetical protein
MTRSLLERTAKASSQEPGPSPSLPKGSCSEVQQFVGEYRLSLVGVSDQERELHIKQCAWLMEDAMRRFHESGCFTHRGEASRWRLLMEEAIRGRSPAQVARMEAERGLSGR